MSWSDKTPPTEAPACRHTNARERDEAYLTQHPADDAEPTGDPGRGASGSVVADHIRAAIRAGHVGQVVIFCDGCGVEESGDYTGETREIRFDAARRHLAETKGWHIELGYDGCPNCPPCVRCHVERAAGSCCASHDKSLCHLCYRRTHFVEVCVPGCSECAAQGLPVNLKDMGD